MTCGCGVTEADYRAAHLSTLAWWLCRAIKEAGMTVKNTHDLTGRMDQAQADLKAAADLARIQEKNRGRFRFSLDWATVLVGGVKWDLEVLERLGELARQGALDVRLEANHLADDVLTVSMQISKTNECSPYWEHRPSSDPKRAGGVMDLKFYRGK